MPANAARRFAGQVISHERNTGPRTVTILVPGVTQHLHI